MGPNLIESFFVYKGPILFPFIFYLTSILFCASMFFLYTAVLVACRAERRDCLLVNRSRVENNDDRHIGKLTTDTRLRYRRHNLSSLAVFCERRKNEAFSHTLELYVVPSLVVFRHHVDMRFGFRLFTYNNRALRRL